MRKAPFSHLFLANISGLDDSFYCCFPKLNFIATLSEIPECGETCAK